MIDFILDSGYGYWIACPFSCNVHDQCIYIHWDCWPEKTNEEWYKHKFMNKFNMKYSFLEFIYYALLHEELHLVLFELGEEDYRIENKTNIFHSKLMTRILSNTITGRNYSYRNKKLGK